MSRAKFSTDSVPFATTLLDSRECLQVHKQINDFENSVWGPDFACDDDQIQPWVDSGCLFYAAVSGEAVLGRRQILSVVSVFVTTKGSRDLMLAGRIPEFELMPWTDGPRSAQPLIYFSSVISDAPHHLAAMYASVSQDVEEFRDNHGLSFQAGFGIASGEAGRRHMEYNGFRLLEDHHYREKYDMLTINNRTAKTEFWRGVFRNESACSRASGDDKREGHLISVGAEPIRNGHPRR